MISSTIEIRPYLNPASNTDTTLSFNVIVTPITATGSCFIIQTNQAYGGCTLSNGQSPLFTSGNLGPGDFLITAIYQGDSNTAPSACTIIQTII